MDPFLIFGGLGAAAATGIGLRLGARIIPIATRSESDLRAWKAAPDSEYRRQLWEMEARRNRLDRLPGRKRSSSIVGLSNSALRRADGSYVRAYHLPLQSTIFAHDRVVEARVDELARLLSAEKPTNTILQFRFSTSCDPGHAIAAHLRAFDGSCAHLRASRLHLPNIDYYRMAAEAGAFRQSWASLWVTVPARSAADASNQGLSAFLPALGRELRSNGLRHFPSATRSCWSQTADDGVIRRLLEDEEEARERAERTFRLIEAESPWQLVCFTSEELWNAVYLGHRQNEVVAPIRPNLPGYDIRDYLCAETIEGDSWYVMHGCYPAAIVSMLTPPQPVITADATRALTTHPGLNFRHTVISEFVYPDQRKAVKRLDRRIRQIRRISIRADGRERMSPEGRAALEDLNNVRDEVTRAREGIVQARLYTVIYGEPARTRSELKDSLRKLEGYCEQVVSALRSIPGAEAAREEPASLRALYERSLVGEADHRPSGREITEVARSLSALVPCESSWSGADRPYTIVSTTSGTLTGLNFHDRGLISSPLMLLLGQPGSGKTTFGARIATDFLASMPEAILRAVDNGEGFGPLVETTGGRHLRFVVGENRTINIWDYPGLVDKALPDETERVLIVMHAMKLARAEDRMAETVLDACVLEVCKNYAPRNGPGKPKRQPTHSDLLAMLESYKSDSEKLNQRAAELKEELEKYRNHPWLDAPTHVDFELDSPFDVYELDSLDSFPQDVRESLAYCVAARVMQTIGRTHADGTRAPVMLFFDEVWKLVENYPDILKVIKKGARVGRRENVVTVLATHSYEDFNGIHDITKTAGVKIIGKQIGDYSKLIADAGLSTNAQAAISAIKNLPGKYAQFVISIGSGHDQIVEMVQVDLSPIELWTFTTNFYERNARARVCTLRPDWQMIHVVEWLAANYPRGLVVAGLLQIGESLIG